ncbi:MAG: plasmid mobilization protein [Azonexus sp.]
MSRSQTRQRGRSVKVALSEAEHAKAEAAAAAAGGVSLSGYFRALLMGEPTPGTKRRPPADAATLARLLGQFGKVGSNLNQLARLGNQGQLVAPPELAACADEVRAVTALIAETLARDY